MNAQELADLMPNAAYLESDEPEMESSLHYAQLALLVACLEMLWQDKTDFFIGANLTIYFSKDQLKSKDFRGPDFFLVKQTEKRPRRSWVVWEEDGKYLSVIIELLSASTAQVDRTLKKELYQERFRTPEYFWFSPDTQEFAGYRLAGSRYEEILPNEYGQRWSQELDLFLGVYDGQLRYFLPSGDRVLTPSEVASEAVANAQEAQQTAAAAQQTAAAAELRAAKLTEQLKTLGVEPEA
ncbi:MAG: Uncharacterized protein conserved in cyanobacteria [Phormidesmis priestleyi Ana]|uniref:Uncharacterized protein conserved in cyanobacteria n=1 Tax=Phormidesmis priestleyi Ana TaxID=1666911 RepID=A0A0P7YX27_9CYAN|nr:MAG: Uncharacterized protein conserved in cyanobacteria [Phormidesmis priestleyi Ana]